MWLFDDILKKPATNPIPPADPLAGSTPIWQGSTGDDGNAPVIIKTEASTVFGPGSEAEAMKAVLPPEPTVHAEEDYSSVLVKTEEPVATVVATPIVETSVVATAPVVAEIVPIVEPAPLAIENPVATAPTPQVDALTSDALTIPQGPSLFDHIMSDTPAIAPTVTASPTPDAVSSLISDTNTATASSVAPAVETPIVEAPVHSFSTPRELIEKSLESAAAMLANIKNRHDAKMEEAESYRKEKMRFAELEKNAYTEAEIMDREYDHGVRMEEIFKNELATDDANRTKKAAHENKHEEKHHKKHEEEKDEEEVLAAS
jgi:hypothetical protein